MTKFLAIDPGPSESAVIGMDGDQVTVGLILPNKAMLDFIDGSTGPVVCEMVASYGMPVGKDVFETVFWIGRFAQLTQTDGRDFDRVFRLDVKMHLCHDSRAKDANIRQALLDRFPATGGGKTPQVGTKSQPGPLFGIKSHLWAALAVAVYYSDTKCA